MHPILYLVLSVLLLLTWSSSSSSSSSSEIYYRYANCGTYLYACGATKLNISYPFRIDGRPEYCGHPGYFIGCSKDNTSMTIGINGRGYQVNKVDYLNHIVTVVDPRLVAQPCPRPYENTSIDFTLYTSSDRDRNVTLYVNCSASSAVLPADVYGIDCASAATGRRWYYQLGKGVNADLMGRCNSTVMVPMHQTTADELARGGSNFSEAVKEGFSLSWTAGKGWCSDCRSSGGYCGHDSLSSTGQACYCQNGPAIGVGMTCLKGSAEKKRKRTMLVLGIVIALATSSLLCLFLLFYIRGWTKSHKYPQKRKSNKNNWQSAESVLHGSLVPKRYKYAEVKRMTESFRYKLGQGGFGSVFKATLPDGRLVAVKLLTEAKGNGEEFINEVASISRTSHVNVVTLLGFCSEKSKRALIYDFMPNGSLEKFIYSDQAQRQFSCEKLYEIALGIARGLEYLHGGCNTRIVHFDIKPHNILLDQDFCPKISDFGLAKLCPPKESIISMAAARGTIGYIAPEVYSRSFGVVSTKSDVYSYGMMLLEMVGGRRNIDAENDRSSEVYFPHWLYDNVDRYCKEGISGITSEMEETMRKMIVIGLWCIQMMPDNRPSMRNVVEMLKGSVEDLQMPPRP